jgi:transcriptional regulator with XRE-family HTH domain
MKKSFGTQLRELRDASSQIDFARKLGVKQTTYSAWERDSKEPSLTTFAEIVSTLGVSADWLLGLSEARTNVADIDEKTKQYIKILENAIKEKDAKISEQGGIIQGLKMALQSIGIINK